MPRETDMPWGVTANLIARHMDDGVGYDLQFPKTGGGEDIDSCRRKGDFSIVNGREWFHLVLLHVVQGRRWPTDLIKRYYIDLAPNSGELLLISCALGLVGILMYLGTGVACIAQTKRSRSTLLW